MGNLCGLCFGGSLNDNDLIMPNGEIRRRQTEEAAVERLFGQQNKGIKNPESANRMQQKAAVPEKLESQQTKTIHPDAELRRRQIAEAAEQRLFGLQNKGIKNPESVKRMQQKAAELERLEREQAIAGRSGPVLRWTQG